MHPVDLKIHKNQDQVLNDNVPLLCANPADLKLHENQNQNEKSFNCCYCDYKSGNAADLKILENQHQNEKRSAV